MYFEDIKYVRGKSYFIKRLLQVLLIILIFVNITSGNAQILKKQYNSRDIVLNRQDTTIYCSVLIDKSNRPVKTDRMYFWYMNGKMGKNMGGYAGYLMHGEYKVFVDENKLIEKGFFKHGLKDGRWITWYGNGNIMETILYKEGLKNGPNIKYSEQGMRMDTVIFKNDKVTQPFNIKTFFAGFRGIKKDVEDDNLKKVEEHEKSEMELDVEQEENLHDSEEDKRWLKRRKREEGMEHENIPDEDLIDDSIENEKIREIPENDENEEYEDPDYDDI